MSGRCFSPVHHSLPGSNPAQEHGDLEYRSRITGNARRPTFRMAYENKAIVVN